MGVFVVLLLFFWGGGGFCLIFKVNKVITEHQPISIKGKSCIKMQKKQIKNLGKRPTPSAGVGPLSGLYLLVIMKARNLEFFN